MKYIVTQREDDDYEEIWLFPDNIFHDDFADSVQYVKQRKGYSDWNCPFRKPISAGFVSSSFTCIGRSETLDLDSRPRDTVLLHKSLKFDIAK